MDPRVKTPPQGITEQRDLGVKISDAMNAAYRGEWAGGRRAQQRSRRRAQAEAVDGDGGKAAAFGGAPGGSRWPGGGGGGFGGGRGGGWRYQQFHHAIDGQFGSLMTNVEQADQPPTLAMRESYQESCKSLTEALPKWEELKKRAWRR